MFKPAKAYQIWLPQSGLIGGSVLALIMIGIIFKACA